MKTAFALALSFFLSFQLTAQSFHFGATAGLGLSRITNNAELPEYFKVKDAISWQFGFCLEKTLRSRSAIGLEALWVQIEGKEGNENVPLFGYQNFELVQIGENSDELRIHSSYVALPLYYRYRLGLIGLKLGIQPMYFLKARGNYSAHGTAFGQPTTSTGRVEIDYKSFDFGPKIGIDFRFGKGFGIRADYYYGLVDIMEEGANYTRNNRQASIGLQYWWR